MMNFRIFSYKTSHGPTRHKLSVLFSLTILWLAVLTGCNPDVFVRHIDPSQRDFTIKEDGDSFSSQVIGESRLSKERVRDITTASMPPHRTAR